MGEALPLNIAPQTTPPTPAGSLPSNLQGLAVTVLEAPADFPVVARPIQINGTILSLSSESEVTVRTGSGPFTLSLSAMQTPTTSASADLIKNQIAELLKPLVGSMKPVALVMQPLGDEEKTVQAYLFVPKIEAQAAKPTLPMAPDFQDPKSASLVPVFTEGKSLAVTVLPDGMKDDFLIHAQKAANAPLTRATALPEQPVPLESFVENSYEQATQKLTALTKEITKEVRAPLPHPIGEGKEGAAVQVASKAASTPVLESQTASTRLLAHGQDATLRIDKILSPKGEWPTHMTPDQIKATVVGKSPSGQTIIHSEGKTLFVHQEGSLPAGTRAVATVFPPEVGARTTPIPLSRERDFAALREMVAALDEPAMQNLLQTRLPSSAQNLGGTLLFFLSALQTGKLEEWFGPSTLGQLDKVGKRPLLDKVLQEVDDAKAPAQDARVGDWKAWPLPLHHGGAFEMLRLYVHEDSSRREQEARGITGNDKTRFLITMNMSRLGAMQMDGLSQTKRLDLVIRSEQPLPPHLPQELRQTYIGTLEALGLTGTISFQTGRQDWVTIAPAAKAPTTYA